MSENPLFRGLNRPGSLNPEDMNDLEKKHTPVITAPDKVSRGERFEVVVETGVYMRHPNEYGHHFSWIELYLDDVPVGRVYLQPVIAAPRAVFRLNAAEDYVGKRKLVARAFCNLHGTWVSEKSIDIE
ncbi:desulfoferrodoxin family protein [Geoglobus acetivorans]|uniref:Desulfoferrodoxin ferrous iron-binding domain-containing protein n=1 Tax=Geoglobus acetivorans TaxID=565033 RepID=A0ABZ3H4F4_GEOAI|nr:superoxide reductase [Geoglobus acetivorans]